MSIKRLLEILWPVVVVATLVLATANIWFGELNQDEGWYLYSGRMVAEGQLPFIDFASTQGPIMAFVYAIAWPLVDAFGVLGGRIFTAVLGLLCTIGAAWLAYRMMVLNSEKQKETKEVAGVAALMTFVFIGINVYQSYFFVIVKTYALAGLLLVCSFLALSFCKGKRGYLPAFISGVFMSLAVATRLSAIAVIPAVLLVYIIYVLRGKGDASHLKTAVWVAAGALLTGLLVFLPFLIKAPEATLFGLVEYHAGREAGGLFKILAYKAGFVARLFNVYFVALGGLLVGGVVTWLTKKRGQAWSPLYMSLCVAIAAVTLLHFVAAFPYDDYQVMIFPLLAVFLSIFIIRLLSSFTVLTEGSKYSPLVVLLLIVFILNMAAAFASPMIQGWFIGDRDRIWWPFKEKSSLAILRETAAEIRKELGPNDLLLTQDIYLAVETGARVPYGLELGPFSYFPNWSREKADACHVLNRTSLIELLEKASAPVAAFSGYGFAIGCPEVAELPVQEQVVLWEILERNYELCYAVDSFGQAGTRLEVFLRK